MSLGARHGWSRGDLCLSILVAFPNSECSPWSRRCDLHKTRTWFFCELLSYCFSTIWMSLNSALARIAGDLLVFPLPRLPTDWYFFLHYGLSAVLVAGIKQHYHDMASLKLPRCISNYVATRPSAPFYCLNGFDPQAKSAWILQTDFPVSSARLSALRVRGRAR